jgi:hypothetical protein
VVGAEVEHVTAARVEVNNECSCTHATLLYLNSVDRDNVPLLFNNIGVTCFVVVTLRNGALLCHKLGN